MLQLEDVVLRRGSKLVLNRVRLSILPGMRLGIVGANGAGKSSLLEMLGGGLEADGGDLQRAGGIVVARVEQETQETATIALEAVLDGDQELRAIEAEVARAQACESGERIAECLARYEQAGGYEARAKAARLLSGLGFSQSRMSVPLAELSGGWRRRVALAKALMCRSNLLLLDEPTNHLDLDAVVWLENWLKRYDGALVLVSHDREFLDAVVNRIAHLERAGIDSYSGNYSDFERQRAQALSRQQANYDRQQKERERLQVFVDRFRAKASKAKQAQSRLKALQRLPDIGPAHLDSPFKLRIPEPARLPRPLIDFEALHCGYDGTAILSNIKGRFEPGQRIALLGPNGAGKSTLIKCLVGELSALSGRIERSPHLKIGYFAQHQLEHLRPCDSALEHLRRLADLPDQQLRDYLGGFGFSSDMATDPIGPMSGGEKARLALALLLHAKPNLLMLDEPTNHLDLDMREALVEALQDFPGGLVLVSHDRYLINTLVDELWLVRDSRLEPFDGDLNDYARMSTGTDTTARSRSETKQDAKLKPAARSRAKLGFNEQRELAKLPARIESLEADIADLRDRMSDPQFFKEERAKIVESTAKLEELEATLSAAYERWELLEDSAN